MSNNNLNDGMERGQKRAQELEASVHFSGATPAYFQNATNAGSTMNTLHTEMELTGSPYNEGLTYSLPCAGNVTGGQLATISGGIVIATAALKNATGVVYGSSTHASGTSNTVKVTVYGLNYLTASDVVSNGDYVIAGSVAHTIQSGAASAAAFGKCIGHAASGAKALVFVGKI